MCRVDYRPAADHIIPNAGFAHMSVRKRKWTTRSGETKEAWLVDYTDHLQTGLERAESFTRAGKLGDAVWEYLQVLEVDPDNATARRQVGQVATAVRQFDNNARRSSHNLPQLRKFGGLVRLWQRSPPFIAA